MIYVTSIHAREIFAVATEEEDVESLLSGLEARRVNDQIAISFDDRSDLAPLLSRLRDAGVAFAGAPDGWPPAEVFADLREDGLVSGDFNEVVFVGKGSPLLRKR